MGTKDYSMELLFKALADQTRLRLLNLMGDDEVCVCYFVEVLQMNQPKISRHLAYLRRAGLVGARRDEHAAHIFAEVRAWLALDRDMRRDRERLRQVCCAPRPPVQLQRAPRPASLI